MRLFVYGSLRQNQSNSHWMSNTQMLGSCCLPGYKIYDLGYYPAAVPGDGVVYGEVYRIYAAVLLQLDHLKNVPREFFRQLVPTPWGQSWIYIYRRQVVGLRDIPGGDWLKRVT